MGQISVNFSQESDENLRERACAGDTEAEEALILRYHRVVRACARPLFLAGGDHEDLLQEGLLGLLTAIRSYKPGEASFRTFAEVCIRSRLLSAVRSAGRDKHRPLNTSVPLDAAGVEEPSPQDPEEMMIAREELGECMIRLETRLSPLERQVLRSYLTGLSYDEIARVTKRSAKSVDNAVQRIRRKLAQP